MDSHAQSAPHLPPPPCYPPSPELDNNRNNERKKHRERVAEYNRRESKAKLNEDERKELEELRVGRSRLKAQRRQLDDAIDENARLGQALVCDEMDKNEMELAHKQALAAKDKEMAAKDNEMADLRARVAAMEAALSKKRNRDDSNSTGEPPLKKAYNPFAQSAGYAQVMDQVHTNELANQ